MSGTVAPTHFPSSFASNSEGEATVGALVEEVICLREAVNSLWQAWLALKSGAVPVESTAESPSYSPERLTNSTLEVQLQRERINTLTDEIRSRV